MNYVKAIIRQVKQRVLFLLNCVERLICFRRRKSSTAQLDTNTEIVFSDFVVVDSGATRVPEKYSSLYSKYSSPYKVSTVSEPAEPPPETEEEEDFFQDMKPQIRKPKTIYVTQQNEETAEVTGRKFRVEERNLVELDEKKFTPFGSISDNCGAGGDGQQQPSTWEDMMAEEELMSADLEKSFQEIRKQKRDHRIRQHQQQRLLKMNSSGSRKTGQFASGRCDT